MKVINIIVSFLRWYVDGLRQPSLNAIARMILAWSLTALTAISADIKIETQWGSLSLASGNSGTIFFIFLVIVALLTLAYSEYRDRKVAEDSQLIKIRHMGLINHSIDDVENYFPTALKRIKPQPFNIEFGNSHKTKNLSELKDQLSRICRLSEAIEESGSSLNNGKKHIVYSGVAPVPMVASVGHLMSNMQSVTIADWDRSGKKWHFNSEMDDGEGVTISPCKTKTLSSSVNLVIALSLPISIPAIENDFPNNEIVKVTFADEIYGYDRLNSSEKQERVVKVIIEFINNNLLPANRGLKQMNIFVAAQASFVFRLGAALNQGHFPRVVFHHFDPDSTDRVHPWGVAFNGGIKGYELVE
jgi:hypothetical protein